MTEIYNFSQAPSKISLQERMQHHKKGFVGDEKALDSKLQRILQLPLGLWFADHPERLESLNHYFMLAHPSFKPLTKDSTFGEAATELSYCRILCKRPSNSKTGDSSTEAEMEALAYQGMWQLLAPLLDLDQHLCQLVLKNSQCGGVLIWCRR